MSKTKKIILITGISLAVLLFGSCTAFFVYVAFYADVTPNPIRDIPISASDTPFAYSESPDELLHGSPTGLYKDSEEALKKSKYRAEYEEGLYNRSEEVFRFEDDDAATVYCYIKNDDGVVLLEGYVLDKENGKYSELRYITTDTLNKNQVGHYLYEPEDRVADSLSRQALLWQGYARANDGKPTYLGVYEDESVYDLRILGKPPTEIIKTEYEGQTYYIWYYIGTDFRQALIDDPDFTFGAYTLAEVIDVLDINFNGG